MSWFTWHDKLMTHEWSTHFEHIKHVQVILFDMHFTYFIIFLVNVFAISSCTLSRPTRIHLVAIIAFALTCIQYDKNVACVFVRQVMENVVICYKMARQSHICLAIFGHFHSQEVRNFLENTRESKAQVARRIECEQNLCCRSVCCASFEAFHS